MFHSKIYSGFCCIALVVKDARTFPTQAYLPNLNLVTIFRILTWFSITVSHILFVCVQVAKGIHSISLAYMSPFGINGYVFRLVFAHVVALLSDRPEFCFDCKTENFN
jgi:amino acid permease